MMDDKLYTRIEAPLYKKNSPKSKFFFSEADFLTMTFSQKVIFPLPFKGRVGVGMG
jgi:hypothetical protein